MGRPIPNSPCGKVGRMGKLSKVGRNQPCPCGSGLKYKNCHLRGETLTSPADDAWRSLHDVTLRLPAELVRFARNRYGAIVLDEAWNEFTGDAEEIFDRDSVNLPVFMPWFFYQWNPDPHNTKLTPEQVAEFPLAAAYLAHEGRRVPGFTTRYLTACLDSAFSFLDVIDAKPGSGIEMRDALTGWRGFVTEKTASQSVKVGDIIFGNVVTLDGVSILDGSAPISLPPGEKGAVIDLRNRLRKRATKLTPKILREAGIEVIDVYFQTAERLLHPTLPKLTNTDGETMVLCTVTYDVPSARAAFDALKDLAVGEDESELLASATYDVNGNLDTVELPWLRRGNSKVDWKNTILGRIQIKDRQMTVEVNSEERAKRFREIADKALPAGSRYLSTLQESLAAAIEDHKRDQEGDSPREDINDLPEVKAMLKEQLRSYYRQWVDMDVPALGGKTPKQAMKTKDGREMVEALLLDFERRAGHQPGLDQDIFDELRATLGIGQAQTKV